jgi:peptide-methionine (S)-S-oxide reductase
METTVGYCGGKQPNPTYRAIKDHTEAIRIVYNPQTIAYEELLRLFWKMHTPYPGARTQYRSAVWIHSEAQKGAVEAVREELSGGKKGGGGLFGGFGSAGGACAHTAVEDSCDFYRAEEYHQKWVTKNEY